MTYTQGPGGPYGQSKYVQPQSGQQPTDWSAPGALGGSRPWDQGIGGAPLAPLQPAPRPRSKWAPPVLPMDGQHYATAYRPLQKRWGRWFAAGAIAAAFFVFSQIPATVWMFSLMGGSSFSPGVDPMELLSDSSVSLLLWTNFSWAVMIVGSIVAMAVYGPKAWRFVLSVTGKWRWSIVWKSFALIGPFFALYIGTMLIMSFGGDWQWNPNWTLVAIVLLTTPLQCAGEEFFFRGFLTQQIGSWIPRPIIGTVVSGLVTGTIFGAMHMHGFTLPTLQLMFVGFVCSMLTWRTGGLEAASVLHICNNMFIMLPLAFMGVSALDPGATEAEAPSFAADLLVFGMATAAMALSYLAVHFVLRKEQRVTEGAPGSEALIGPAPVVVAPPYGSADAAYASPYAAAAASGYPVNNPAGGSSGYPAGASAQAAGQASASANASRWAPPTSAAAPPAAAFPHAAGAPPTTPPPSAPPASAPAPNAQAASAPAPYGAPPAGGAWRANVGGEQAAAQGVSAHRSAPAPGAPLQGAAQQSAPSDNVSPSAPRPNPYAPPAAGNATGNQGPITSVPRSFNGVVGHGPSAPSAPADPSQPGHEPVDRARFDHAQLDRAQFNRTQFTREPRSGEPAPSAPDYTQHGAPGGSQGDDENFDDKGQR